MRGDFHIVTETGRIDLLTVDLTRFGESDSDQIDSPPLVTRSYTLENNGRVTATLSAGLWFPIGSVISVMGNIAGVVFGYEMLLYLCLVSSLLFLLFIVAYTGSLIQQMTLSTHRGGFRRHEEHITPIFLLLLLAPASTLVAIASHLGPIRYLLAAIVLLPGIYIYSIQNFSPRNKGERFRFKLAIIWLLPWSLVLSTVLALTRIERIGALGSPVGAVMGLGVPAGGVLLITVMWLSSSENAVRSLKGSLLQSIHAQPLRLLWFGVLFSLILVIDIFAILVVGSTLSYITRITTWDPIQVHQTLSTIESILKPLPELGSKVWLLGYLTILFTPILILFSMWVQKLVTEWRRRRQSLRSAEKLGPELLGFTPEYPTYQTDLSEPTAQTIPIWHRGKSIVLIDRILINNLDQEQLQAVYYHEYYHVRRGHGWILDILLAVGPIIGGVNATLPYWFPRYSELDADQFAVEKTDTKTVKSALVEIERLMQNQDDDNLQESTRKSERIVRLFANDLIRSYKYTYILLFGLVQFGSIDESIDYRIQQV